MVSGAEQNEISELVVASFGYGMNVMGVEPVALFASGAIAILISASVLVFEPEFVPGLGGDGLAEGSGLSFIGFDVNVGGGFDFGFVLVLAFAFSPVFVLV